MVNPDFQKTLWTPIFVGLSIFLFAGVCAAALAYDAWLSGFVFTAFAKALAAALFGFVAFLTAIFTLQSATNFSPEVIPSLLRKSGNDETPSEIFEHAFRMRQLTE
ncbi:MAG: hypothetical protein ACOY6K_07920 [Pseudomonadota bacterium]